MVSMGSELIRYNPSTDAIEYSTNRGSYWCTRCSSSSLGNVKSLITCGDELICCSDRGVFYSTNRGSYWCQRTGSYRNFINLQDCGNEIIAMTDDGHVYYSTNRGAYWCCRR